MEKKFEVSKQNFIEGKAIQYWCNAMQCVKFTVVW